MRPITYVFYTYILTVMTLQAAGAANGKPGSSDQGQLGASNTMIGKSIVVIRAWKLREMQRLRRDGGGQSDRGYAEYARYPPIGRLGPLDCGMSSSMQVVVDDGGSQRSALAGGYAPGSAASHARVFLIPMGSRPNANHRNGHGDGSCTYLGM